MKLIIDIDPAYYSLIKYGVEQGQEYKPFEIIANGIPYENNLNNSIKTIKSICKDNNTCNTCPMNWNCNEHPSKWEEVK